MMVRALILSVFVFLAACSAKTPEQEVSSTITEMIELIDDGDVKGLFEGYVYLPDFEHMEIPEDELYKHMPQEKLNQLRTYLVGAKTVKPVVSENGTLATLEVESQRTMYFKKVDGKWFMRN